MLITFLDGDRSHKPDQTGHNKIGYIAHNNQVLYSWRNKIIQKSLSAIERLPHRKIPLPEGVDRGCVERFFIENFQTIELFNMGFVSLLQKNFEYFANPIKLPRLDPIDLEQRDFRWKQLTQLVRRGDALFTFDTRSFFSKLIAFVDNGPWSHVAMCTDTKTVIEAITSGVQERELEVYAHHRYRVGLYRPIGLVDPEKSLEFMRAQIGKSYAYSKAAVAGLQKFLNRNRLAPTPNDLAISRHLFLICYV